MPELRAASVERAVERVLENMCFTTILGPAHAGEAQSTLEHGARVAFRGKSSGAVLVGLSHAGAHVLASGFLGEDNVDETQTGEFTAELANMICGAIVSQFAPGGQYALASPCGIGVEEIATAKGLRVDLMLEEGFLSVIAQIS